MNRVNEIRSILEKHFSPSKLDIIDNSHLHAGHAGSKDGAGHYQVIISANALNAMPRVKAHQAIYQALAHLMPREIHALQIQIKQNET